VVNELFGKNSLMNKLVALIGYPLTHSISPFFQQAAFGYYQLGIRYENWEIELSQLEAAVNRLRQSSILGANVTIPYKEAVLPLLNELDELVVQIGAANTIVNRDGRLLGYNTDAPAFIRALRQDGDFEPRDKQVVLLGAGGVARAASFALVKQGVRSLTIVNRTLERVERLAASLREKTKATTAITILPWEELESSKVLSHADLLVNCTSMGMKHSLLEEQTPLKAGSIPKDALVYDLVYNPRETLLLKEARKAGARVLGGLAMLVYQGAASFELWVGKEAPLDIMFRQAGEALGYE
jgi:shikimate dehydrogenase